MSAKKFMKTLAAQISQDLTDIPTTEELQVSFKEAVDNLPKGKLRKSLRADFDSHLDALHSKISKKLETRVPAPYQPDDDGNLSELSTLDERPDIREPGSPRHNKPIFCVIGKLRPPDFSKHKDLTKTQKQHILCSYIKAVLGRKDVDDDRILDLLRQLEEFSEDGEEDSKSRFCWLFRMDTLLRLSALHNDSKDLIRFMRILFREITSDVEKVIEKEKAVRAGRLSEYLHGYLMSCHMMKEFSLTLQEEDRKPYGDLMSALLAFYVDMRLVHASKISKKKAEGRQLCGLVAYWLKDYPESLLELVLQLYGPLEENQNVILPLVGKSLEKGPVGNSHYLKYILVVKTMSQKFGQDEMIDYLLKARSLSCNKDFLSWLEEICPEVHEEMPTNDKKFKGRKVTKFLLDDADDNMVSMLLDSLRDIEEDLEVPSDTDNDLQKVLDLLTSKEDEEPASDQLFFIDKGRSSSDMGEPVSSGSGDKGDTPVLKTLKEMEDMLDVSGAKPFKIDPHMIGDETSDQEFFDFHIVSIKSFQQSAKEADESGAPVSRNILAEDTEIDTEEPNIDKLNQAENEDNSESESDSVRLVTETEEEKEMNSKTENKYQSENADSSEKVNKKIHKDKHHPKPDTDGISGLSEKDKTTDGSHNSHKISPSKETKKKKRKSSGKKDNESLEVESQETFDKSVVTSKQKYEEAHMSEPTENSEMSKRIRDKPSKSLEEPQSSLSEMDQSVSEIDQISLESTVECENNSFTSSRAVEVDTESFDISKSELSRSTIFSADGEITMVHLGDNRNIITDTATDDDILSDNIFEDGINDNESKSYKKDKKNKKKKKSHDSEVEEILTPVKVNSKMKSSKASNSSVNSQDTSQEESELDKTERYVDGYAYKSPYNDTKTTRKFSSNDEGNGNDESLSASAKKKKKKRKSEDSVDPNTTLEKKAASSTSFEEKFIAKALRKTPKKTKLETDLNKSAEKKKHKHKESKDRADDEMDGNRPKSPTDDEVGKKKVKKASEDLGEMEKDQTDEDRTDKGDNLAVPEEATEKKSGRLTPQKMFEILNDVKQMTGSSEMEGSKDDKSEKGLSEYESESCIEIASESQSEAEPDKDEVASKQVKQQQNAMEEIYASENMKFEGGAGIDINDSTVSVIDLVSECEDKNSEIVENSLSEGESLGKSPKKMGSKLKSPKKSPISPRMIRPKPKYQEKNLPMEENENKDQEAGSPDKTSKRESPAMSKELSLGSSKQRQSSESDKETVVSPKQKPVKLIIDVVVSPTKTPVKILTPKEKPIMIVNNSEEDSDIQGLDEDKAKFTSPSKTKTPPNTPASSPRKSPRISALTMDEKNDYEINGSEQKEMPSSKKKQKQKSPGHVKSADADEITVHKSFSDKEYTPGKKRHSLRSPDLEKSGTETPNVKILSSHKKRLQNKSNSKMKPSATRLDTESESDIETVPDLSQHLKSPLIPVITDKIHKGTKVGSEWQKENAASENSESELDRDKSSPKKQASASDESESELERDKSCPKKQALSGKAAKGKGKSPNKENSASDESKSELERDKSSPKKQALSGKGKSPNKENSASDESESELERDKSSLKKQVLSGKAAKGKGNSPNQENSASDESESELERDESSAKQGSAKKSEKRKGKSPGKRLQSPGSNEASPKLKEQQGSMRKEKQAINKSQSEDENEADKPSPKKMMKLSFMEQPKDFEEKKVKKSKLDIYDFHSETDQSDREERMPRKSSKMLKLTEELEETTKGQKSSRRRSMFVGTQPERDDEKHKMTKHDRSRSMGAIAERDEASDENDEEEDESEIQDKRKNSKSPIHRTTRQRKEKEMVEEKVAKKAEKVLKETKVGQKRKSVSYTGLKEKGSEDEEVEAKKATPPRRRSERKALTSKKSTPPKPERKLSASTSKKPAPKKVEEMRKPRKRRLSGELSKSESESVFDESSGSEVSFPLSKKVPGTKQAEAGSSKRTATQSTSKVKASKSPEKNSKSPAKTSKQRYSLRKK